MQSLTISVGIWSLAQDLFEKLGIVSLTSSDDTRWKSVRNDPVYPGSPSGTNYDSTSKLSSLMRILLIFWAKNLPKIVGKPRKIFIRGVVLPR